MSILINLMQSRDGDMGDIEFLAIKNYENKLVSNNGSLNNGSKGTLTSLTAKSGKDLYLVNAIINSSVNRVSQSLIQAIVKLIINNITVSTYTVTFYVSSGESTQSVDNYSFPIGYKVTEGQIIKLQVISSSSQIDINGTIQAISEDSGVSPALI